MLVDSSESDQLNINDINASEKLLGTCVYLLTDDAVLEDVASKLGPSYNADRLRNILRVEALSGTMIIRITAETDDPELSARICNEMAAAAPGALRRVIKSGSVEMVGAAKPAKDPSSPNVVVNSILGMLLGFALSVVIIALLRILDNTVKDEHDLKRVMDVPVLGENVHRASWRGSEMVQSKVREKGGRPESFEREKTHTRKRQLSGGGGI